MKPCAALMGCPSGVVTLGGVEKNARKNKLGASISNVWLLSMTERVVIDRGTAQETVELISPERLGHNFRWIWPSATISNLGEGIVLAAG